MTLTIQKMIIPAPNWILWGRIWTQIFNRTTMKQNLFCGLIQTMPSLIARTLIHQSLLSALCKPPPRIGKPRNISPRQHGLLFLISTNPKKSNKYSYPNAMISEEVIRAIIIIYQNNECINYNFQKPIELIVHICWISQDIQFQHQSQCLYLLLRTDLPENVSVVSSSWWAGNLSCMNIIGKFTWIG